jgi:nucleoside-diphosphate-sugar epimerase
MQKVVIVGCGWLGKQLATVLNAQGFNVFGSRQSTAGLAELPDGIQPLLLQLPLAVPNPELCALFNDSWLICTIPPAGREQSATAYSEQLQSLVDIAIEAGVRGVIHCSSSGVYQGLAGDVDEQSVVQTTGRAGVLLAAEKILQQIPNCITLRLAGLIGPGRDPARFGQGRSLAGAELPVNLVHAADIARFVLSLLERPSAEKASLFNLCCPEHPGKAEFYHAAAAYAGLPPVAFTSSDEPPRIVLSALSQQQAGFYYQFQSPLQALGSC